MSILLCNGRQWGLRPTSLCQWKQWKPPSFHQERYFLKYLAKWLICVEVLAFSPLHSSQRRSRSSTWKFCVISSNKSTAVFALTPPDKLFADLSALSSWILSLGLGCIFRSASLLVRKFRSKLSEEMPPKYLFFYIFIKLNLQIYSVEPIKLEQINDSSYDFKSPIKNTEIMQCSVQCTHYSGPFYLVNWC